MKINLITSRKLLATVSDVLHSSAQLRISFNCFKSGKNLELKNCFFGFNFIKYYTSYQRSDMETTVTTLPKVPLSDDVGQADSKRKFEESEPIEEKKLKVQTQFVKTKIKKFAILLSYCGVNYFGLQRNANVKTIEGDLFDAFLKLSLIKQEQYDRPQEFFFQRAARTDKGVSAIKQILSCRMPETFSDYIPQINDLLPPMIRVIATKKTTKHFDCKNYCDGRTYAYIMPSFALASLDERTDFSYRVKTEHIDRFNQILKKYEGTHNFFNFTSQKISVDPSAMRYIISMECGLPFIRKDLEFVQIRVRGQSFMMHQIRKMIGLAIGVIRGLANEGVIDKAFELQRLDIPKAPGLGLMLEEVHYDKYNKRYSGDGIHEALTWDEYNDVIQSFVEQFIHPVIVDTEINELSMMKWLQLLPIHTFGEREPGPPIPIEDLSNNPGVADKMDGSLYRKAASNIGLILQRSTVQKSEENPVDSKLEEKPDIGVFNDNVLLSKETN